MWDANIRAFGRGLDVLEYLCQSGGAPRNELVKRFGLSRATILRILQTLHQFGLISEGSNKVYRPTLAVSRLSAGVSDKALAIWAAQPVLLKLQREVTWTCELTTYENYAMVPRETTHALNPYGIKAETDARRSMLLAAAGRAYLAFCPPAEAAEILQYLERHGDPVRPGAHCGPEFHEFIESARFNGFATERRQTPPNPAAIAAPIRHRSGVVTCHSVAIAAPIRHRGRVLACLSISWMPKAIPFREGVESFAPTLLKARASIESAIVGGDDLLAASDGFALAG
ncbi:MAG: helix-turn-helix domain-containing protein [Devosia sp.]|nr:helix-turn-helix domain-containing protein [Devosia sp.]